MPLDICSLEHNHRCSRTDIETDRIISDTSQTERALHWTVEDSEAMKCRIMDSSRTIARGEISYAHPEYFNLQLSERTWV